MIKKYIIFPFLALGLLTGCLEEEVGPFLSLGNAPSITSPSGGTSLVLTEDSEGSIVSSFDWTAADFGFAAGVEYKLELDKAGNNFADPISLGITNKLSITDMTVGQLNSILLLNGIADNVATPMELRVVATVSDKVDALTSAASAVTITAYKALIIYPKLQVPGAHQGWDPANETTVIFSRESDGTFEGFLYFPDPNNEFKFTDGPSWDVNYGDTGGDGTLEAGGDNIQAPNAGFHRLRVNINNLTYTSEVANWGLIGSATPTGWDSDTDLVVDPATGVASITIDLVEGEIKFRANDDWVINLGDFDANGSLEYDGDNIQITEAGNYTIELLVNVADYTYKVTKN
jgi:hypothetical protein